MSSSCFGCSFQRYISPCLCIVNTVFFFKNYEKINPKYKFISHFN